MALFSIYGVVISVWPALSTTATQFGTNEQVSTEETIGQLADMNYAQSGSQSVDRPPERTIDSWELSQIGIRKAEASVKRVPGWVPASEGTIFMVRTVTPTLAQEKKILSWAADLRGSVLLFVILVDVTWSNHTLEYLKAKVEADPRLTNAPHIWISGVNDMEIKAAYPRIVDVYIPDAARKIPGRHTLGRWFFVECLAHWYIRSIWSYSVRNIWLVEDDIGWSGDIHALVREYENETADLVTVNPNRHPKKPGKNAPWYVFVPKDYMRHP